MKYSDRQRLQKITETGHRLLQYLEKNQLTPECVLEDYTLQWTITTPLYNIGEHTYHVSAELKQNHPEIPWNQVSGLRHRLVHDYDGTNWNIVNEIIFRELPLFIQQAEEILSQLVSE